MQKYQTIEYVNDIRNFSADSANNWKNVRMASLENWHGCGNELDRGHISI